MTTPSSRPPAQPASAPPPPAFTATAQRGAPTLGIISFIAALVGIIAGSALNVIAGTNLVAVAIFDGETDAPFEAFPTEIRQAAALGGILVLSAFAVMAGLSIWAIVQGIFAAVKKRGRGWGITAIVLGVVGFLPVALALPIGMAAGSAG